MIQLNPDCLLFQMSDGEIVPCSAASVAVELVEDVSGILSPEVIQNAAAAVLHYFKNELGRETVSVGEFSQALELALRGFGVSVQVTHVSATPPPRLAEFDLCELAGEAGGGFELFFFSRLREALRRQLHRSPQVVHCTGLRGCVKQLLGTRRWSPRCQNLSDQIVHYLRGCWSEERGHSPCALVVA